MTITKLPTQFVKQLVDLSWRELKYGRDHQLIDSAFAIDKAAESIAQKGVASEAEVELAGLTKDERAYELVEQLALSEPEVTEEVLREKWVFLVLAWLFENRSAVSTPLSLVEEIYSDFDYPSEMRSFVPYVQMVGPDLGSREKNEARIYDRWREYLDLAQARFRRP